ncbi:MAG: hypothetical protein LUE93_01320 [Bacteroides sp.]|nr:hypothetical protein [Bacteroides sp.]
MQTYKKLLANFKKILTMRIHDEKQQMDKLTAITGLQNKSLLRRLRGEYKFTFEEMFNICRELGISIESLAEKNPASVSSLHVYRFPDNLSDISKSHIGKMHAILENALRCENSSFISICNRIPEVFHMKYKKLSMLLLMKLNYFTNTELDPDFYRLLDENWDLFSDVNDNYNNLMDSFRNLTVIWSPDIILNTVRDISFFLDIGRITQSDANAIKEELKEMLKWIEQMCETPQKSPYKSFTFAVSPIDMNFYSNTILSSKGNTVFHFIHHLTFTYTENEEDIETQKVIIDCMMRGATILSGSNYRERKRFMKQQYEELEKI